MNILFDAFISYGRADSKAFATKLHNRLVEENLRIWFDQNDIPLGVDYQNQIDDGIEKAHNFLFIIAPHSVNSPYCLKEIVLALKRNKRIIPLLHVEQITQETWQQRNPNSTAEEWETYQAQGKHTSFQNMHPTISKINWVYFREGIDDFETAFAGLINLLQRHDDYVEQHTRFLAKALEWERHQKQTSYLLIGEERREAEDWLKIRFKDEQAPCLTSDLHCEFITESIKNGNNLMTQVFLSYADADRGTMEQIRNSLRRESITVWTNKADIPTGEAFQEAVDRGIEQADNVVYLLSPESVNSDYCQQELDYTLSLNKRIIPVLVRETDPQQVPIALQNLQYIDLTDNVKEEDYLLDESQLLRILYQDAAYYNEHKILLTKALKWKQQHDNPSILLRGYNLRSAQTWLKVAKQRTQHPPTLLQQEFINASLRQPPASSLDVFISYSRADSDFARKLNDALQMQGKTTWFDQESIASGSDFEQEIKQGIKVSDNFLFIISPRSINSPYCAGEVEYAASLNKRFVTILYQDVNSTELHPELAKVQWIDFNQNQRDFNANFNQLVRTLDTDREHVHSHTKWLQRAIEWKEENQNTDLLLRGSEFLLAESWLQKAEKQKKQPAATPLQQDYITASREAIEAATKQEKRQVIILRSLLGLMSVIAVVAVGVGVFAIKQNKQARLSQTRAEKGEIESLGASSEARFALGENFEALLIGLKAAKKFKAANWTSNDTELRSKVMTALQQPIYQIRERNRLEGHQSFIWDFNFSPDGQTIATASWDKTAKLWRLDGTLITTLKGHNESVSNVKFSPDGQTIATASSDKTAKLWRLDGTLITTLKGHEKGFNDVQFSPDGQTIATASWDKTAKLWRLDGTLITTLKGHNELVGNVQFSPNGQTIATASSDKTAKLWRLDGTLITTLKGHAEGIRNIQFSPNGQTIATASGDKTAKLWRLDGTLITTLKGHEESIRHLQFSPDGQTIATASNDKTAKLWRLDGTLITTLKGHDDVVTDIKFSPDGKTIATASNDRTAKLWRLDGTLITTLTGHNNWVWRVRFSPDGKTIATASFDRTVKLWNLENSLLTTLTGNYLDTKFSPKSQNFATVSKNGPTQLWRTDGTLIATLINKNEGDGNVEFSPDGQTLVTSNDTSTKLWKANGTLIATLLEKSKGYKQVVYSKNSQTLAITTENGLTKLWRTDGTLIATPINNSKGSTQVSLSPDSQTFVTVRRDETSYGPVQLWKTDGTLVATLLGKSESQGSAYVSVDFSADGKTLSTAIHNGDSYGPIKLWKADGTLITTLVAKSDSSASVSFSEKGQTLVTSVKDGSVKLWKTDGTLLTTLISKSEGYVQVFFSPDGQRLVTINDSSVKLWKADGTLIATLITKNEGFVDSGVYVSSGRVSFSLDGQIFALTNQGTVKLWKTDGTLLNTLTHSADINEVRFSPDSKMFASASADKTIKLWNRDSNLITTFTSYSNTSDVTSLNFSPDSKILSSASKQEITIRRLEGLFDLDNLFARGCERVRDYLKTSTKIENSDRHLCDGIKTQK